MDRRALLFTHPLFELHPLSFFAFRVFRSAFGIVLGIAVMVGLFSRVPFLFWGSLLVCVVSLEGTLFRALPRTPSRFRGRETPIQLAHRLSPWLLDRLPLVLLRAHIGASPIFFHLIAELVHSRDVQSLLARLGTDAAEFAAKARERIQDEAGERLGSNGENRRALRILIEEAFRIAEANGSPLIAPAHLFAAARRRASLRPSVARFFAFFEIEDEYLSLLTLLGEAPRGDRRPAFFVEELYAFARNALTAPIISFGRAFSRPTPTLRRFGAELPSSRRAARVARLVGHAPEWEELLQTLSLKRSRLAVLVGPPHSGRGALVERLARSARDQGSPAHLAGCRFFRFDLIRLIQQKTPREVRALSDALAGELERSAESVVVYFSAIEHLFALSLEMRTALE
ncbi:MAG: hypothetical protein HY536_01200, partial [Candidatus Colwellbacteria bacterium]|nr:hypothetical protein [Candidatus Colwellbacteria bacterium]